MSNVNSTAKKLIANIEKVVVGKRPEIILGLVAYFSADAWNGLELSCARRRRPSAAAPG